MRVIEAEASGLRYEGDAPHPMWRDEGRALHCGAVDVARDHLAVPVNEIRHVGIVVDIEHGSLPLLEAQQRAWKLAVVERRRHDVIGSQFCQAGRDPQGVVGLLPVALRECGCDPGLQPD